MHALPDSGGAVAETGDLHGAGESGEGPGGGLVSARGRALAANVLWLDANPDARQELAQASPGAVSLETKHPLSLR